MAVTVGTELSQQFDQVTNRISSTSKYSKYMWMGIICALQLIVVAGFTVIAILLIYLVAQSDCATVTCWLYQGAWRLPSLIAFVYVITLIILIVQFRQVLMQETRVMELMNYALLFSGICAGLALSVLLNYPPIF
jgi:hypothetical protein